MERRWAVPVGLLGGSVVVAVVAVVIGLAWGPESEDTWFELSKAGIQLAVLTGLGGIVTLVLSSVDASREKRRVLDEYRFEVFRDLVTAYNSLKAARRNLRAVGLREWVGGDVKPGQVTELRARMTSVIDVQLAFERIYRELDAKSRTFSQTHVISTNIHLLEIYVGALVSEWEWNGGRLAADGTADGELRLDCFHKFLGPAPDDFRDKAARPMGLVEWAVRDDLLGIKRKSTDPVQPVAEEDFAVAPSGL